MHVALLQERSTTLAGLVYDANIFDIAYGQVPNEPFTNHCVLQMIICLCVDC
jgi:hypothetical protein